MTSPQEPPAPGGKPDASTVPVPVHGDGLKNTLEEISSEASGARAGLRVLDTMMFDPPYGKPNDTESVRHYLIESLEATVGKIDAAADRAWDQYHQSRKASQAAPTKAPAEPKPSLTTAAEKPDPALEAVAAWIAAEEAFEARAKDMDEDGPEYRQLTDALFSAEAQAVNAPITTLAGANIKVGFLLKECREDKPANYIVKGLATVLQFLDGQPSAQAIHDPLVALNAERERVLKEIDAGTWPEEDHETFHDLENRILKAVAVTPAGAAAQLRALRRIWTDDSQDESETKAVDRIIECLDGMGGGTVPQPSPTDDALLAMAAERERLIREAGEYGDAYEDTPEAAKRDALNEECYELERRMAATPAHTIAGIAAKLRIAGMDIEEINGKDTLSGANLRAALADAERLSVGAVPTAMAVEPDPAVETEAAWMAACKAFCALPNDAENATPELWKRLEGVMSDALDRAASAPVTTNAGVAAKIRMVLKIDYPENAAEIFAPAMAYLAGNPSGEPEPDPVVKMFADWRAIQDEINARDREPDDLDGDPLADRRDELEKRVMRTSPTSMAGIAIKARLVTHWVLENNWELAFEYATPARDVDFEKHRGSKLDLPNGFMVSLLRDAERLAGGWESVLAMEPAR